MNFKQGLVEDDENIIKSGVCNIEHEKFTYG